MNTIIGQPINTSPQSRPNGEPALADPGAVTDFNARMAAGSPQPAMAGTSENLATDEQLGKLAPADLQRLQEKWGNDEIGLRKEAYDLGQFYRGFETAIVMQIMRESNERRKELESRMRS